MAGATVSVGHGVQELLDPRAASDFLIGYAVLTVAFLLEGCRSCSPCGRPAERLERCVGT